ncbi:MAG: hypothetical protein HY925_15925 [Elusimicrobia bacterium]|nr:hypothetical protein [Elusimicrobiota bacterium]
MLRLLPVLLLAPVYAFAEPSELERLQKLQAQFAPVEITADVSKLPDNEKQALGKLVEAAKIMDALFLRQCWAGNESMLLALLRDASPLGQARLRYFLTQKGPWDRQDHNKPFIPGAPEKPAQADFYPVGATKEKIEKWISTLPPADKEAATGFFSTIRVGSGLKVVPYSQEYANELALASRLLGEAAELTKQPSLKRYLEGRAAAFLTNDYYASDVAWMELDASIEPTIGPYETYEDEWFGYKAAFEAFITLRDDAETQKLQKFGKELQGLEDNLPIKPEFRNPKLGALAPIRVVNQVYASGDADRGVTTAAFNLPNDERVTKEKGSKRTMLKNVQEAKFNVVLTPLAKLALAKSERGKLDFESFFTHILMHEVMHGLGPHEVYGQKDQTVRKALQDVAGALEEAKADISGLWALQRLIDKGVLDKSMEKTMYVTFLASGFRTLRFGVAEAHGRGMALQMNYLLDKGGFTVTPDGWFAVDASKIKGAVEALTREIMEVQAKGDYAAAKALFEKYGAVRPQEQAVIDRAKDLPVDIAPRHTTAESLLAR